jgi:16S rRNA C967 or C1407 C5-methylase (RsmB/RsmF family)
MQSNALRCHASLHRATRRSVASLLSAALKRLASALPVDRIPGFADGVVSVQDAGAQLAARLFPASRKLAERYGDDGVAKLFAANARAFYVGEE